MKVFKSSDLNNKPGTVLDAAVGEGAIVETRHSRHSKREDVVMISRSKYEKLVKRSNRG